MSASRFLFVVAEDETPASYEAKVVERESAAGWDAYFALSEREQKVAQARYQKAQAYGLSEIECVAAMFDDLWD